MSKTQYDIQESIQLFCENLEEAVLDKQISPDARKEVRKQRELHRKTNVRKDTGASNTQQRELHVKSPMKKNVKQSFEDNASEKERRVLQSSTKDDPTKPHPDMLWNATGDNEDDSIPFMYVPKSKELFYANKQNKVNKDPHNLSNYYPQNARNPIYLMTNFKAKRNNKQIDIDDEKGHRIHNVLLNNIINIAPYAPNLSLDAQAYDDLEMSIVHTDTDKLIMGRYYNNVISFWNLLDDSTAKSITRKLQMQTGVPVNKIYVYPEKYHTRENASASGEFY